MFDGHGLGFGMGFMWLFWFLVIVVIAWMLKAALRGDSKVDETDKSPLEILEDRFARGEIDEHEFERKRKLLKR
jgi:putative membrane protein